MLEIVRRSIASAAGERRQASPGSGRGLARVRDGLSVGPEWQQPAYGEYYARSADVYAAVRLRAKLLGERSPVGPATGRVLAGFRREGRRRGRCGSLHRAPPRRHPDARRSPHDRRRR